MIRISMIKLKDDFPVCNLIVQIVQDNRCSSLEGDQQKVLRSLITETSMCLLDYVQNGRISMVSNPFNVLSALQGRQHSGQEQIHLLLPRDPRMISMPMWMATYKPRTSHRQGHGMAPLQDKSFWFCWWHFSMLNFWGLRLQYHFPTLYLPSGKLT